MFQRISQNIQTKVADVLDVVTTSKHINVETTAQELDGVGTLATRVSKEVEQQFFVWCVENNVTKKEAICHELEKSLAAGLTKSLVKIK